ncbi:MAG: TPM domain-containing protein [Burkholderiales bacterium]|nr:TPM domain-containing protein [Burkholderiales bacterium]
MRARTLAAATLLLALALALGARAQDLAAIPPLKARVTDVTGTLSAAQVASLEESLAAFEQKKGSQIAVLIVPTTKPEPIEQYAIRVAEQWKVGRRGVDDGAIIVVAKDDHRLRIEVGYGLEGAIPDIKAKRVIREVMAPHFVDGDFYGGLQAGTQALMQLIEGEDLPPPAAERAPGGGAVDYESALVLLLVVTIILAGVLTRLFGRFFGSVLTGGAAGLIAWIVAGALAIGILAAVLAFVFALAFGGTGLGATRSHRGGWGPGGGWPTGGWGGGGGGFGGGSWSGGGGTFGGGGASGSWGD